MVNLTVRFMHHNKDHVLVADEIKSIVDLKSHIEKHHGIHSDNQIIVALNFVPKNEWNSVTDHLVLFPGACQMYEKISPNESIAVEVSPRLIIAGRLPDSVFCISSEKSVLDLKLMIDKELGGPPCRQVLTTMKADMKDELPLHDYILARSLKIQLDEFPASEEIYILGVTIHVNGEEWGVLAVDKDDTVYTLHGHVRRQGIASGHDFYFT